MTISHKINNAMKNGTRLHCPRETRLYIIAIKFPSTEIFLYYQLIRHDKNKWSFPSVASSLCLNLMRQWIYKIKKLLVLSYTSSHRSSLSGYV